MPGGFTNGFSSGFGENRRGSTAITLPFHKPSLEYDPQDPLNRGLVAWWPCFGNQRGGGVWDVVRTYRTTNNSETPYRMISERGPQHAIDGTISSVDYHTINTANSIFPGLTQWSVLGWIWYDHIGNSSLGLDSPFFGSLASGSHPALRIKDAAGYNKLQAYAHDGTSFFVSAIEPTSTLQNKTWHHVGFGYDGTNNAFWFDGAEEVNSAAAASGKTLTTDSSRFLGGGSASVSHNDGLVADVRVYDRMLSAGEAHDLYTASRRGYPTQFKRRSFPVSTSEAAAAADSGSTAIRLRTPKSTPPSYKSGYAKSASESAMPSFWMGLEHCIAPVLGITGDQIYDLSGKGRNGTFSSLTSLYHDWAVTENGWACQTDNSTGVRRAEIRIENSDLIGGYAGITCFAWVNNVVDAHDNIGGHIVSKYWDGTDRSFYLRNTDSSGNPEFGVSTDTQNDNDHAADTTNNIFNGGPHFLVGTWDARDNTMRIYTNGIEQGTATQAGSSVRTNTSALVYCQDDYAGSPRAGWSGDLLLAGVANRAWTPAEIARIAADPLAPFRQRRSIPLSSDSVEPTVADSGSSVIRLRTPRSTPPSYKSGYAKSAAESAYPNLWDGLVGAWVPALGPTGGTLMDISGQRNHGTLNMALTDWLVGNQTGEYCLDFYSTDYIQCPPLTVDGAFTVAVRFKLAADTSGWLFHKGGYGTADGFGLFYGASTNQIYAKGNGSGGNDFSMNSTTTVGVDDGWHTAWLVYNGSTERLFLDQQWEASNSKVDNYFSTSDNIEIGGDSVQAYDLRGQISAVYLWDRALTNVPSPNASMLEIHRDPLAPFRQRRSLPIYSGGEAAAGGFNHWYARFARQHRIIGSGVHV